MAVGTLKRFDSRSVPVIVLSVLLLISLYLLTRVTENSEEFGRLYSTLLILSVGELIILTALIGTNLLRLARQYRSYAMGSRLTVRLVIMFVIIAVLPVSIVYYFSLEFLRRGIDSWFDVKTEEALHDALELSRGLLDERMREQLKLTERMALEMADVPQNQVPFTLDELRYRSGAAELTLFEQTGSIIGFSSVNATAIVPTLPHESIMLQVRQTGNYVGLDPIRNLGLHVRVLSQAQSLNPANQPRILQSLFPVADRMRTLADGVQSAYEHYEKLSYLRGPLKFSYILTLSLVLLLSLLTAVWAAFYSARRLVAPIRLLAIGTRQIAEGDYGKRLPLPSNDELGYLVESFNNMSAKIAKARDEATNSQAQAEAQRAYLEAVLGRLSSGVLAFDRSHSLRTTNDAAMHILGADLAQHIGQSLVAIREQYPHLNHFVDTLNPRLDRNQPEWREEITLLGPAGRQVLMCRGTSFPAIGGSEPGHVIVFDDITALIQAQRDAAWGEVARRLAHEIKNPLTPIQLSAERLRHKYLKTMETKDAEVLDKATHTIVQQVETMKEMVNAFSDYARTPRLHTQAYDVNKLIDEVLDLYRGNETQIRFETDFAPNLPVVGVDSGRLRQLLHNLIKNAVEAVGDNKPCHILISTQAIAQFEFKVVEMRIEDRGPGFPEELIAQLFEPYVTTKPKGTGLGLAIVKKIVEEHSGVLWAENSAEGGARIIIRLPAEGAVFHLNKPAELRFALEKTMITEAKAGAEKDKLEK